MHDEFREFGYNGFGPLMLQFQRWLQQATVERGIDRLFFLAREGYVLQDLYQQFHAHWRDERPQRIDSDYLLLSRRAVFGALEKKEERSALLEYLHQQGLLDSAHTGLVGLGYSAAIQKCLHEITGRPLTGFYFATSSSVNAWRSSANDLCACFGQDCGPRDDLPIIRYAPLLRACLTSPDPPLLRFRERGAPEFAMPGRMEAEFPLARAIFEGMNAYIQDVARTGGDLQGLEWACQPILAGLLRSLRYQNVLNRLIVKDDFHGSQAVEVTQLLFREHPSDMPEAADAKSTSSAPGGILA